MNIEYGIEIWNKKKGIYDEKLDFKNGKETGLKYIDFGIEI